MFHIDQQRGAPRAFFEPFVFAAIRAANTTTTAPFFEDKPWTFPAH
jgi:hypothetical protein